ncbi:MAG: hypothetical protein IV108_10960 [Burkholderiales bacterium]|nr:hypothetical protein [Burkholderiales bacterium]
MKHINLQTSRMLALVIAGMLLVGPAIAEKPSWAGEGKSEKKEHKAKRDKQKDERRDDDRSSRDRYESSDRSHKYFEDRHHVVVRDYYQEQFRHGRCPPGLAKKHNGCMPPGQAKKWSIGHRLPRDVIYYDVPDALIVQIGRPSAGHRYVRVATDILLIAVGSGMVIDAIEDLGRM